MISRRTAFATPPRFVTCACAKKKEPLENALLCINDEQPRVNTYLMKKRHSNSKDSPRSFFVQLNSYLESPPPYLT